MKINEVLLDEPGDEDDILFEMSNFSARTTGLPSNLVIWVRSDPLNHGHNKYRIKVIKDNEFAAIYLVSATPKMIKDINRTVSESEDTKILEFVQTYSSLIISLIDCKIDSGEFALEIMKHRGRAE